MPCLSYATGGGGIEYMANIGPDLLPLQLPGSISLQSGSVAAFSGFGYGVTRGGWKIGGFGLFFYANDISAYIPDVGTVTDAMAWYGGLISGGQARLGPLRLSLNLRLGAGMAFADFLPTASFYGSVDGEIGLLFVPAMLVSAYAGVGAIASVVGLDLVPAASVIAGVRITWGSF